KGIYARLYPAQGHYPRPVLARYRENHPARGNRFVLASDTLAGPNIQSYIHDTILNIHHRRRLYRFRVFFKRHVRLPVNQSIQRLSGIRMEGDVLLVACGRQVTVRNLRSAEGRIADKAMRKYV
ncbi:hypothetical protein FB446DRAFT_605450, partial [Lentinula raphanica]